MRNDMFAEALKLDLKLRLSLNLVNAVAWPNLDDIGASQVCGYE